MLGWAACVILLLKGFGFSQLYLILWFWDRAPINISSYIFLHMIFIANNIHEIGNTSKGEWYVKSLLLLGNLFKSKAANCYSIYDSSVNPWALLLKLGKKRHCEMKVNLTYFKVKIFSAWMVSKLIGEKKNRYRYSWFSNTNKNKNYKNKQVSLFSSFISLSPLGKYFEFLWTNLFVPNSLSQN